MFDTVINISETNRGVVVDVLNQSLANLIIGQLGTKFSHWNVKGAGFYSAHKLFDKINDYLLDAIDLTAERITALGGTALGRIQDIYDISDIPEYEASSTENVQDHIKHMATVIGFLANQLRDNILLCQSHEDLNSADLCTEISRELDQYLYFLESHLR